jgi:glutathione-specific gamma-glutamylcyclotransferase
MALWVFGYGSLIWEPGFDPAERRLAVLPGWARRFCMWSIHHRGTAAAPGLVLALDRQPDAACTGVAFRVRAGDEAAVMAYLRERELISSAYLEEEHAVRLDGGPEVAARVFVVDRDHPQYCGALELGEQAAIIARAAGGRGPNDAYLHNTHAHLGELGIADPDIAWLDAAVRRLKAAG